ncbi:hypothetical protein F5Y04DRAFT_209589 [Hypomontagnella monticulosa]|nr:hypothetical protein F5Y04DRAFT_209589 [Hypomontagnella monticulosa]
MPLRLLHPSANTAPGAIASVDIIAVHGLNPRGKQDADHAWDTWRTPPGPQGRLWLRDDLPLDLPESRIFLYEYNSTVVFGKDKSTFLDKANKLLEEIRIERYGIESRPILFLGHSMGGLLIKQALINAHSNTKYTPIKTATKGLVFFATPHHGADGMLLSLADTAHGIAASLGLHNGGNILKTLKSDSMFSDMMVESWRHQLEQYHIVSFWGTCDNVVLKKSACLNLSGDRENIVSLDADHSTVCKFGLEQPDQDNLKLVRSNIRELYESVGELYEGPQGETPVEDAEILEVLRTLDVLAYEDRKNRNREPVDGTCKWATTHQLFRTWLDNTESSLLRISADPGCGKSVLARHLIDKVLSGTARRTISYFFFKDDLEDQRTLTNALCCILRQIIHQNHPIVSKKIIEQFKSRKTLTKSFQELWDILIDLAGSLRAGEIVCVIDALDECEEDGQNQLTQALNRLYSPGSSMKNKFTLKFLLTSRPYMKIQRGFRGIPTIHLNGDLEASKISQEITIFIKDSITNLSTTLDLSSEEQEVLEREIMKITNRTYLWVYLVLDMIKDIPSITEDSLKEYVLTLPPTVEAAYDKMLCRSRDREQAKRLLSIVIAAARPLSVEEMSAALAIKENHRKYADLKLEKAERFYLTVRELCGLFVMVVDSKIYLLHQTAKEFLVNSQEDHASNASITPDLQWKYSLDLVESHRVLAEACIWYHQIGDLAKFVVNGETGDVEIPDSHGFCEYSANYWVYHYRQAQFRPDERIQDLVFRLISPGSVELWYHIYIDDQLGPAPRSTLSLASFLGLEEMVKRILNEGVTHLAPQDSSPPLSWAAWLGHNAIVSLLLERGTDIEAMGKYGETPLFAAARKGHDSTVRLLLDKGANIEAKGKYGETPLFKAVIKGRDSTVRLLLERGACIEARNESQETPLFGAVSEAYDSIIQLLLDMGADIEARNQFGRTPLFSAVVMMYDSGKIERGAWDFEVVRRAVYSRGVTIVQVLLDKGADIEARDQSGRTPLFYSITRKDESNEGKLTMVRLLLERGADQRVRNVEGTTALLEATMQNSAEIVKLLLKKNSGMKDDAMTWDYYGRSPLFYAVSRGNNSIILALLAKLGIRIVKPGKSLWVIVMSIALLLYWKLELNHEAWGEEVSLALLKDFIDGVTESMGSLEKVIRRAIRLLIKALGIVENDEISKLTSAEGTLVENGTISLVGLQHDGVYLLQKLVGEPWDEKDQIELSPIIQIIKVLLKSYKRIYQDQDDHNTNQEDDRLRRPMKNVTSFLQSCTYQHYLAFSE